MSSSVPPKNPPTSAKSSVPQLDWPQPQTEQESMLDAAPPFVLDAQDADDRVRAANLQLTLDAYLRYHALRFKTFLTIITAIRLALLSTVFVVVANLRDLALTMNNELDPDPDLMLAYNTFWKLALVAMVLEMLWYFLTRKRHSEQIGSMRS